MGLGLRFEQDRHSDDGICAVGRWDLGWEMGIGSPFRALEVDYRVID